MATRTFAFRTVALSLIAAFGVAGAAYAQQSPAWDKAAWSKKLDEAKKAEGNRLIQYDNIPNYANWGGVVRYFNVNYGVLVPPDMKGSSATLAALLKEKATTVADVAYYSAPIAAQAGIEKGVHQPYKPVGFEKIPDYCKDPDGKWFCVHEGVLVFIVNTEALSRKNVPVPKCWKDLLHPQYKGLVAYDDPTVQGTAWSAVVAAIYAMGGSLKNLAPGIAYLKELDKNILRYARDTSYNPSLRGEVAIWFNADGNGYKMKWDDKGPIEVVVPCEGTISLPLAMGMVTWSKRPMLAKAYLDWLLGAEAQGIWSESYFNPIIKEYATAESKQKMKPLHGSYDSVKPVSVLEALTAVDAVKNAWLKEVKRQ